MTGLPPSPDADREVPMAEAIAKCQQIFTDVVQFHNNPGNWMSVLLVEKKGWQDGHFSWSYAAFDSLQHAVHWPVWVTCVVEGEKISRN